MYTGTTYVRTSLSCIFKHQYQRNSSVSFVPPTSHKITAALHYLAISILVPLVLDRMLLWGIENDVSFYQSPLFSSMYI